MNKLNHCIKFFLVSVVGIALFLGIYSKQVLAADEEQEKSSMGLFNALAHSKVSLADGIKQSTKGKEVPISAKYELDDKGKLSLSVYTAENSVFKEISGNPELAPWNPESEVIKDSGDLKDAQEQWTVLSKAKVSLLDVAQKAGQENSGNVLSVIPQANHNDIEVKIVKDGKVSEHHYDITSGNEIKMEGKDTDEGKDNDGDKY